MQRQGLNTLIDAFIVFSVGANKATSDLSLVFFNIKPLTDFFFFCYNTFLSKIIATFNLK